MQMENRPTAIGSLFENAGEYLETRLELLKLKAIDKTAEVTSSLITALIILVIIVLGILFLNIGLSIWIGSLLGQIWYGFFAVGGFYILLAIILLVFKSKIIVPLNNSIVKEILN